MNSKYNLLVTQEHMTVCTSKYEAVVLAAIDGAASEEEESCQGWTMGISDRNISERTLGVVLPREIPKYIGMLVKKGILEVVMMTTSPDRPGFSLLKVIECTPFEMQLIGREFEITIKLDNRPSDLAGCFFTKNGATYEIHHRDICFLKEKAMKILNSKTKDFSLVAGAEV